MEPAIVFSTVIVAVFVAMTGFAIYTAFGPPSKELTDPFEEHED